MVKNVVKTCDYTDEVELVSEDEARACLSGHVNGDEWALDRFQRMGKASSPNATYERLRDN